MDCFSLQDEMMPWIVKGDVDSCLKRTEVELREIPETPYHQILDLSFSNPSEQVAGHIRRFLQANESKKICSVYLEMNGFDINTDEWYYDLFGFDHNGGHEDYEWLCDWQTDHFDGLVLTGMEALQKTYEEFLNSEAQKTVPEHSTQEDEMCSLALVQKFQKLIQGATELIGTFDGSIFTTAHDYEFIAEFKCTKTELSVDLQQKGKDEVKKSSTDDGVCCAECEELQPEEQKPETLKPWWKFW